MQYTITIKNHLRVLRGVLIYHVIGVLFFTYAMLELDNGQGIFPMVFGIGYGVSMIPVIFLHIEYYLRNKNDIFQINCSQKSLIINGITVHFGEIDRIFLFMPDAWKRNSSMRVFPFENYRYAKIQMKNGNKYIFTCLMAFDLDKVMAEIQGIPIVIKVRLVATPLID